jgi:hypothetical protein
MKELMCSRWTMRFEYYTDEIANEPKLSIDGTVPNAIHFSHWKGNQTPRSVKADTSTEIVLNLVAAPDRDALTQGIDLVTNNHFDTDGVLSVWTVLTGAPALELNDKLIAAAEAGDFSELRTEDGVRASIVIQGFDSSLDQEGGSPLANQLAGEVVRDDARAYELVLPEVERVLTQTNDYESLWREPWGRIAAALDSFANGTSQVVEDDDAKISLVTLAPEIFSEAGFKPTRHAAPFTAISQKAKGQIFLIATPLDRGWSYRIDYPYYSWAETIVRPTIKRRDLSAFISELNRIENSSSGSWCLDSAELASAAKFADPGGKLAASALQPDVVAAQLRSFLLKTTNAQPTTAGAP